MSTKEAGGTVLRGFTANGTFNMGGRWVPFKIEVVAPDEKGARHQVVSTLGSRHHLKTTLVRIKAITALDAKAAGSILVKQVLAKGGHLGRRFVD